MVELTKYRTADYVYQLFRFEKKITKTNIIKVEILKIGVFTI